MACPLSVSGFLPSWQPSLGWVLTMRLTRRKTTVPASNRYRAANSMQQIRWKIPFGEFPELAAKGLTNTGSDNYGGPVATASGLLFIGATNFDRKFHAYDTLTGALMWETTLPAAGNATPAIYELNGRQYVVIACGGGKNGAPSGSTIVAFALP